MTIYSLVRLLKPFNSHSRQLKIGPVNGYFYNPRDYSTVEG